jgi:hypothetical protein
MKKSLLFSVLLSVIFLFPVNAQISGMLKSVKKSVTQEISGSKTKNTSSNTGNNTSSTSTSTNTNTNSNSSEKVTPVVESEPPSACDHAVLVMETGKYKIEYTELSINILDDGTILLKDVEKKNYYIVTKGITEGPYKDGDPKITGFKVNEEDENEIDPKDYPVRYSNYITRSGDKLLITFNGKKYGPYSVISKFTVSKLKDKFVAVVTENMIMTPEFIQKYEEKGKNIKTDQERMQLSMQMSAEIQQKTDKYGPQSDGPIYVTNIPGASFNKDLIYVERFYTNIKYDEIVTESGNKIFDYKGKELISFGDSNCSAQSIFISSDNNKYACFSEGVLTFNDNKEITDLFNPSLLKADGKIYLAYMYYSPKSNAIMQCKIPF